MKDRKKLVEIQSNSRSRRWVENSRALERIEPFMIVNAQGLGRLDVKLIQDTQELITLALIERGSPSSISREEWENWSMGSMDHLTLSYLWVLGAYELVRTIDQHCRGNPLLLGDQLNIKVTAVKHTFERIRIPLAKFEPSRRHQETDSSIAWPAIHQAFGVSWRVAGDVFISRKELSDSLLDLLDEMSNLSKPTR